MSAGQREDEPPEQGKMDEPSLQPSSHGWNEIVSKSPIPTTRVHTSHVTLDAPPGGHQSRDALQHQEVEDMVANRKLREKYASKAYELACACITFWIIMIAAQGVLRVVLRVETWDDKVIIAVTTGVTVSVLAAFLGVIRGLFPMGTPKK